ncbi:MAG: cupin domain-containing protein [Flavobacterium sp.]|nr:MAG: cupin domain-containing protein [Flavobacterium sp.]
MKSIKNKKRLFNALAIFSFGLFLLPVLATAQKSEIKRTELQQHDLSIPGKEMYQSSIDFGAHTAFGKHYHHGEEIIYVLKGTLEYEVEGKGTVILKAGEVLFVPAGVVHSAKNNTDENAIELATYIVDKDKPVVVMKK